jgi:hypothetical protein
MTIEQVHGERRRRDRSTVAARILVMKEAVSSIAPTGAAPVAQAARTLKSCAKGAGRRLRDHFI